MPTTIGPITNVPLPGDPVDNDWAVDLTTFAVNNIQIGATAPTDPNAELWYDTADGGVSFPNMPRGLMGYGNGATADQTFGTTATDITGMTVTFAAKAGRLYEVTAWVMTGAITASTDMFVTLSIVTGAAVLQRQAQVLLNTTKMAYAVINIGAVIGYGTDSTQTLKIQMATNVGQASYIGTTSRNGVIIVKDIGGT